MMTPIESAFRAVPRVNFLPRDAADMAELNMPVPIGFGQTNSQPETVERMLEWLEVVPGDRILDVGSGSGWTTALLAALTGPLGHVWAVEIIPELVEFGRRNCRRFHFRNVEFHQAESGQLGWPVAAPYDRILVSAAADTLPDELVNQLKPTGRMIIPVRDSIWIVDKDARGSVSMSEQPGFIFVPLIATRVI